MGKLPKLLNLPLHFPVDLHYPSVGKLIKENKRNAKPATLGAVQAVLNGLRMTVYANDAAAIAAGYNEGDLYITEAGIVRCVIECVPTVVWEECPGGAGTYLYVTDATQAAINEATLGSHYISIVPDPTLPEARSDYSLIPGLPEAGTACNFFESDIGEKELMPIESCPE